MSIGKTVILFAAMIPQIASAQLGGTLDDAKARMPYAYIWSSSGLQGFPESETHLFSDDKTFAVFSSIDGKNQAVVYIGVKRNDEPPFGKRQLPKQEIAKLLNANFSGNWEQQATKNGKKLWSSPDGSKQAIYSSADCTLRIFNSQIPSTQITQNAKQEMNKFERYIRRTWEAAAARVAETGP